MAYTTTTDFSGTLIRCDECRARTKGTPAYPRTEADVQHAATCSAHVSRPAIAALNISDAQRVVARQGGVSHSGLSEDEITQAVGEGRISSSDALNRDY